MQHLKIALDGPAGSGKSTVAKKIAEKLGIEYIDTGAMYRAVTLKLMQSAIPLDDPEKIEIALKNISLDFIDHKIHLDGQDVSEKIREPEVTSNVSQVAAHACVRRLLVQEQQNIASNKSIVMDGRDIGTHVLPESPSKFFLTASIEERAKRRYDEMTAKGFQMNFEEICKDIDARDQQDMNRKESPLVKAEDAELIDTTALGIDEVVDLLVEKIRKKVVN